MNNENKMNDNKGAGSIIKMAKLTNSIDEQIKKFNLPPFLNGKKIIAAAFVILLIFILSFSSFSSSSAELLSYKVERKNFFSSLTESGELRAKNSLTVPAPRIRGTLKITYLIPEGTIVSPGDTVVRFDPSEALIKLKDSKASLEITQSEMKKLVANQTSAMTQMESQLKTAELSFELSKIELEQMKFEADVKQRQTKLQHQKNELSFIQTKQEYESKKIIHEAELAKMELEIEQKKGDLKRAENDLARLILLAPANGLVIYGTNWSNQGKKFAIGDQPWPGSPIIKLPDLSKMESVTFVNEVDVSKVKVGQEVKVTLDAYQDTSFVGKISNVASVGKNKEGNQNIKVFEVLVSIEAQSEILKPGMTTSNKILLSEVPDVLFIPHEAVFSKENSSIVYIVNGGSYDEQKIETADKSEDYIVVTKGLEDGDAVALEDPTIEKDESTTGNQSASDD